MSQQPEVTFPRRLSTLKEIVENKQREFPIVVKTRNKMVSYQQLPIEEEGKLLFVEQEMEIPYARIKVLKFHDEDEILSARGAELVASYHSFIDEEFYIPTGCDGKLKIVKYPGKRSRYMSVTQIMEENPRRLKANANIMAVPPRHVKDKCLNCISSGTIVEPKAIIHKPNGKYLKCVDSAGTSYFLRENCMVDFTAMSDERIYTLQTLKDSGVLLPAPIQFEAGTISPYDVVHFHDNIANDNLVITSCPLELVEIVCLKVLVARTRQNEQRCYKTVLFHSRYQDKFFVQEAEFTSLMAKSKYIERKFGGCAEDTNFVRNKMYLLPTDVSFVCWIQRPSLSNGKPPIHFCDSSDSDSDYEVPEEPEPESEVPPPVPEKTYARRRENEYPALADLNLVHTTVLLPIPKIQDQDVLHKIKEKARLGFGSVHAELKKMIKRKQKDTQRTCSLDMPDNDDKPRKKEKVKSTSSVVETKSTIQREPSFPISKRRNVPLPPIPREEAVSMYVIKDSPKSQYDYVEVEYQAESKPEKVTARIQPISVSERIPADTKATTKFDVSRPTPRRSQGLGIPTKPPISCPVPSSPESPASEDEQSVFDYGTVEDHYDDTKYPTSEIEGNTDLDKPLSATDIDKPPSNTSFFLYTVDEVVQCLQYCGMSELAKVCKEQKLDGGFFESTRGDDIHSLFNLSRLDVLKLEKIYEGWRPKLA